MAKYSKRKRKFNRPNSEFTDNSPIFKFIKANSNDILSEMSGAELQDLIVLLDDYYIKLRKSLGLEQYITFGMEIEFEHAMRNRIETLLAERSPKGKWRCKSDSSLTDGAEIATPVLRDTNATWCQLDKVCSILQPLAKIGKNSGGHIHVGAHVLGDKIDSWLNFIKIWSVYENIIFRFSYGSHLTYRPRISNYAQPVMKDFWSCYEKYKSKKYDTDDMIYRLTDIRRQAVNFNNVDSKKCATFEPRNTIEFRCPNGSLDPAIWQNNINFFVRLLCYAKNSSFNDDIVERRGRLTKGKYNTLKLYDEIYLEQALELSDMIFTNNFDKVCFLRQYLKSYQTIKSEEDYTKTITLTK